MKCGTPTSTPTPSDTSTPIPTDAPSSPATILPSVPGVTSPADPTPSTPTAPATGGGDSTGSGSSSTGGSDDSTSKPLDLSLIKVDPTAPVMTLPASRVSGSSLTIIGPHSVSIVKVRLANGSTTPVIKIVSDEVAITDFSIDTRDKSGRGVVNTAGRMDMKGHVIVYLNSVAATLGNDTTFTLGVKNDDADTKDLPSSLLRVDLGLVGLSADELSLIPSHEVIS
jgi:hypothetical protein